MIKSIKSKYTKQHKIIKYLALFFLVVLLFAGCSERTLEIQEINNFFNKIPYLDDIKVWGEKEYWATPLEFLAKAKGDCEDYVIAKYFSLGNLGIAYEKLYFSYVKSKDYTRLLLYRWFSIV